MVKPRRSPLFIRRFALELKVTLVVHFKASGMAAFFAVVLWSSTAAAQTDPATAAEANAYLTSSSSSTTTTIVGGVILTVVLTRKKTDLQRYLQDNAVAVKRDFGRGAGETFADIADVFGIAADDRPKFAALLRANRRDVLELVDPRTLDLDNTTRFVELVLRRGHAAGLFQHSG